MLPVRLDSSPREKVWGSLALEPWFARPAQPVGEVWFTRGDGAGDLPLLVKLLFTSERLSVQVHPDDEYAREHEASRGKTEMWHVLRADQGACLALGFRRPVSKERARKAALSGEIEQLLEWTPVSVGETYLVPAGTVHAIGPGLALCEIQENSDVTYRLYDYGRSRGLHLDRALEVANLSRHPGKTAPQRLDSGGELLAHCAHFATENHVVRKPFRYKPDPARFHLLIFTAGQGTIAEMPFRLGECWMVPEGGEVFEIAPQGTVRMLRTYVP